MMRAKEALAAIRRLPIGGLDEILWGGTPVVLAPHPDDEVIGCGNLLFAAAKARLSPVVVCITEGSGSHPRSLKFPRHILIDLRQSEACAAARILGVGELYFMGIRDTAAPREGPELVEAVNRIVEVVRAIDNPVILAPWAFDPHGDHEAVHQMGVNVAGILSAPHLSYVVWGWTLPETCELNVVDIAGWRFSGTANGDQKFRALNAYRSQVSDLIDDDPTGFRLDTDTLKVMLANDEAFLLNP